MRTSRPVEQTAFSGLYTPSCLGNLDAPEEDQITVRFHRATHGRKTTIELDAAKSSVSKITKLILETMVAEVFNYQTEAGVPIRTGADLFEHGEFEFVDEIAGQAIKILGLNNRDQRVSAAPPA